MILTMLPLWAIYHAQAGICYGHWSICKPNVIRNAQLHFTEKDVATKLNGVICRLLFALVNLCTNLNSLS